MFAVTHNRIWTKALALLACLAAPAMGEGGTNWEELHKATGYTLGEAIEKGLAESGEGIPFHAGLERDKGAIVYSIDVAQDDKTCNVVMDAKDATVLENEVEDEDHSGEVATLEITLSAAIEKALSGRTGAAAVEAELALAGEKPVVTVKVLSDGKVIEVKVDGVTGEASAAASPGDRGEKAFTDVFHVEADEWSSTGTNPWFVLEPGFVLVLEGKDEGEDARLTITILDETKVVAGVETRIMEEREEVGGELIEVSRNFFAISRRTNSVYYFGEEVDMYADGKVVSHDGAWLAGEKEARYGIMMPGTPLLAARYYQEIAPEVAMDRAEIVSLADELDTPAGKFSGCLKIEETTPLERGREFKIYAPGIGLIKDGGLRLTKSGFPGK